MGRRNTLMENLKGSPEIFSDSGLEKINFLSRINNDWIHQEKIIPVSCDAPLKRYHQWTVRLLNIPKDSDIINVRYCDAIIARYFQSAVLRSLVENIDALGALNNEDLLLKHLSN